MNNTNGWIQLGEVQYNGSLKDGIPHGKGDMKWPSCIEYSGDFSEGSLDGFGIMKWPSGQIYEGQWTTNIQEGNGIMHYPNGNIYEGLFHDGMRHGHGILRQPDNSYYEGIFCNDKPTADGTFHNSQGRTISWAEYNEPQKPSIAMKIWYKSWRLLAALGCFLAAIVSATIVFDFFSGNGPSHMRVKGILAPVLCAILGFYLLLSFFKHLFNKND